jgi:hypothetical protein
MSKLLQRDQPMTSNDHGAVIVSARGPHSWSQRERLAVWIGAGLAGGLALATLSPRHWSRLGAALFGGSAWVLRSPIGPALLAAVLARASAPDGDLRVVDVKVAPLPHDA